MKPSIFTEPRFETPEAAHVLPAEDDLQAPVPATTTTRSEFWLPPRAVWTGGVVLALLIAAGVTLGLRSTGAQATVPAAAPAAMPVSVATVAERRVATWNEFSGRLEAVDRVDIRPRVAGTVLAVHFREGALVGKGDLLLSIDPAPYAAEVERAEAQVVAAQARRAFTASELERARRLLADRAIAQREHDERANAASEADANLRAAEATLRSARLNLDYTQVRAPVSGRTGRAEITAGNLVAAGASAPVLTTLVSVSPIYASFDADEQIVGQTLRGLGASGGTQQAQIQRIPVQMGTVAGADTPFSGKLQWIDNQVDTRSGTVRLRAVFDNRDGSLIPGQFARLRMGQPQEHAVVLVNERAIGTDQDKKFVLVVGPDNKAVWRAVTLGAPVDGLRIVTSGLQPGEQVVVNGLQRVRPGALLDPQPVAMEPAPERQARDATRTPQS